MSDGERMSLREPAHRVSPRARAMWRVSAGLEGLVAMAALTVAVLVWDAIPAWTILVVGVVFVVWIVVVPQWRFLVHRWETTDTAVYTQTGWWTRERRIAPMSRIQTVDYSEGAIERLFRLASVTVTTASAAGPLEISGLDRDVARGLVDDLTLQADAVEGDAT
ncbi:PH domain-containing protein [Nocardioides sp. GXZ039]|uniref:PH domain-containing protein n=1 Tax=Nocardioides sp. GXZ039 TaxID=3136018 RepID=UPI0030F46232